VGGARGGLARAVDAVARAPLAAGAAIAVALALLLPTRLPLLVLPPLALAPRFARDVATGRPEAAARATLLWALSLSVLTIAAVLFFPERMAERVIHGPAYRDEMLRWIETGIGKEGDIRAFLPEHVLHAALLLVLSFATGGLAGLLLGALLLNYMNFYVASLGLASERTLLSLGVGWPIWSIVRVVGFVLAATAVAGPFYGRFRDIGSRLARGRRLLAAGALLIALDIAIKHFTADSWRHIIRWSLSGP
jgi:hypothetical protein